ncbi:MAG TPA: cytochrome c oxidase subunit 3 [Bacteroidia bacterium]|nr:cytochrome c oxidase subunit 3 [Bacteroidia bacterium]
MTPTLPLNIDAEFKTKREKARRNLMWLALGSMIMIFAGLTSAYVVRKGGGDWFSIVLPQVFWISSAVIILSSVTMNIAVAGYRKNNQQQGVIYVGITFLLGLLFAFFQFRGYQELTENGIYFVPSKGQTSLISGSFIYVLSGLHLAHLAGGLIALAFIFVKGMIGKYRPAMLQSVRVAAIYWHFLDFLWIYLFVFLTIFK